MCNRSPTHIPGRCPPIEVDASEFEKDPMKWMRLASSEVAVNVLRGGMLSFSVGGNLGEPDPRDAELATLREQLADAMKVVDAAREWRNSDGWIETPQDSALVVAVDDYDAKHSKNVR